MIYGEYTTVAVAKCDSNFNKQCNKFYLNVLVWYNAYSFSLDSSRIIHNFLSNRKQRTRIHHIGLGKKLYSLCRRARFSDLFCLVSLYETYFQCNSNTEFASYADDKEFASYADDNTPYLIERNIIEAIKKLELACNELVQWFSNNKMKSNSDMFHLLTSLNDTLKICINW